MMPFARVPTWIIDSGVYARLSTSGKAILPVLGRCLENKSDSGYIAIDRLCDLAGIKKSAAYRALSELSDAGIIDRGYGKKGFEFREAGNQIPGSRKLDSSEPEHDSVQPESDSAGPESHPYRSRPFTQDLPLNSSSSEQTVYPRSQPEIDQEEAYRAARILHEATDPQTDKRIWPGSIITDQQLTLGSIWVLHNKRNPDELHALIAYALETADRSLGGLIASLIKNNWTPEQPALRNGTGGVSLRLDEELDEITGMQVGGNA